LLVNLALLDLKLDFVGHLGNLKQHRPNEEGIVVSWVETVPKGADEKSQILSDEGFISVVPHFLFRIEPEVNIVLEPLLYAGVPEIHLLLY